MAVMGRQLSGILIVIKCTASQLEELMDIGTRLRMLRKLHGLSQRELAKRSGVTNGTISLIEQERISPSISSLKKVLDGIPMSLVDFFTMDMNSDEKIFFRRYELPEVSQSGDNKNISFRLVGHGSPSRSMQIMHEIYQPGGDTGADPMLSHSGEEGGVIVQGEMEITVGAQREVLLPGDAYYFDSRRPHRFRNIGDTVCIIVSANSPPTF